jgi:hypothetical protein
MGATTSKTSVQTVASARSTRPVKKTRVAEPSEKDGRKACGIAPLPSKLDVCAVGEWRERYTR